MHAQWGWDPVFDPLHNIPLSDLQKLLAAFAVCFGSLYLCCEVLHNQLYPICLNMSRTHCSTHFRIHPTSTSSVNTSVMSSQYLLSQGHFSMVNLHKDILCQLESAIQLAWVFLYYGKDPVINNHRCAQWTIRLFDVAKLMFFIPLIVLKLFIQPPLKFLLSQCWICFVVAAGGLFLLHWYLLIS